MSMYTPNRSAPNRSAPDRTEANRATLFYSKSSQNKPSQSAPSQTRAKPVQPHRSAARQLSVMKPPSTRIIFKRLSSLLLLILITWGTSACFWYPAPRGPVARGSDDLSAEAAAPAQMAGDDAPRAVVPTYTPTATLLPPTDAPPAPTATLIPPTATAAPTATPVFTGAVVEATYLDTFSVDSINELIRQFYPAPNQVQALYAIDRYQIRFETVNELSALVSIRAEIYVPRVSEPTPFPVFAYGAGTTGIGNDCAPLDEVTRQRNWGGYRTHMLSYASQGYISVLPLWQGYDDATRTHPYFISELEGYILLDATRAVYKFFEQPPSADILAWPLDAVFYGGYSQGGHGAFAADKMAPWYAPELSVRGIVGHAAAPNVEALMRERPSLAPYIIYAYRDFFGKDIIRPEDVFLPQWVPTFNEDAATKCVDEVYSYYPSNPQQVYTPDFAELLFNKQLGEVYPIFQQTLDMNYAGTWTNIRTPAIMLHGATDPIVTPGTVEEFIGHMCQLGKTITYNLYPGINHFVIRQNSFVDTLQWMEQILNGESPRSDCARFAES